jgi:hypothetical protein
MGETENMHFDDAFDFLVEKLADTPDVGGGRMLRMPQPTRTSLSL